MPEQYRLGDFVSAFKDIYKTIDVRAALVTGEDRWQGIFVALRVSVSPPTVVQQWFENLVLRYGKMDSSRFRVVQHSYPFSDLERLVETFAKGQLVFEDWEISFETDKAFFDLISNLPYFSPSKDKPSVMSWPVLQASVRLSGGDRIHQLLRGDRDIVRFAEVSGYYNPYSAISQLLEVSFDGSMTPLLSIELDVPARIDAVTARRVGLDAIRLKIYSTAYRPLSELLCTVRSLRQGIRNQPLEQKVISLDRVRTEDYLEERTGEVDVSPTTDDYVTVELLYRDIGRLCFLDVRPAGLLQTEERNPLFRALTFFCPLDTVKHLLERPDVTQAPKNTSLKDKAKLYEVSVQWLLTCLGLRAIWLHGYENFKHEKFDYGAIDCLAYHEPRNVLLLVNCTTGPPNPNEMNRQIEVRYRLTEQAFSGVPVELYPVLFTASHKPDAQDKVSTYRDVRIFYQEDIPKLIAFVETGKETRFLDAVISPSFFYHL